MNTNMCVEHGVVHESYYNSAGITNGGKLKTKQLLTSGDVGQHTPAFRAAEVPVM